MTTAAILSKHAAAVTAACRPIENADEAPSLADLAAVAGIDSFHSSVG